MTPAQASKIINPPEAWRRKVIRVLGFLAKTIEMSVEERSIAEQVALFQYTDPKSDALAAAQHATRYVWHRRRREAAACNEPQSPLSPVAPAATALPIPETEGEPSPPAQISDEDFLVMMAGHIEDLSHSFRRSYNLRYEDMDELAQELRIKCCAIPPEMRIHRQYCKTALNNRARDWWRSQHRYESRAVLAEDHDLWEVIAVEDHIDEKIDAEKFLLKLSDLQRDIVSLAVMTTPAWTPAKIAKHLKVPTKEVEQELTEALRTMREYARQE